MQGPPESDEPVSPQVTGENQDVLVWLIRLLVVAWIATVIWRLWVDDEIRLHALHGTMKGLQSIARLIGSWALQTENFYNDFVDTLH